MCIKCLLISFIVRRIASDRLPHVKTACIAPELGGETRLVVVVDTPVLSVVYVDGCEAHILVWCRLGRQVAVVDCVANGGVGEQVRADMEILFMPEM